MTTCHTEPTATVPPLAIECLRAAIETAQRGDTQRALSLARGLVRVYGDFAPAWNVLATVHIARREGLAAAIALTRCVELDPGHAPANITLGELALRTGNAARARAHLETALQRPEDLSRRRRLWAEALRARCTAH